MGVKTYSVENLALHIPFLLLGQGLIEFVYPNILSLAMEFGFTYIIPLCKYTFTRNILDQSKGIVQY